MALTDAKARAAKIPEGKKQTKVSDSGGLFLLVTKSGKYWRLKYRFAGKEKTLSIGIYPDSTLKQARKARDDAKEMLAKGIDPNQAKQLEKAKIQQEVHAQTFEGVALEWLERKASSWTASTAKSNKSRLERHIFPWIRSLSIASIEPAIILSLARRIEEKGHYETAHRVIRTCGQVFRYGVACQYVKSDPTRDLRGALTPVTVKHLACLTDPHKVGALMRAIQGCDGTHVVVCALRLSPLVFLRPKELRCLQWDWIDFENKKIVLPATVMKKRTKHIVPLSAQALDILEDVRPLTGGGLYVFPSIRSNSRPMSENTINTCLKKLGYNTTTEQCAHGFRGTASTLLHEQGFQHDHIEIQLSHLTGNSVSRAYNHADHIQARTDMMQQWADYLDALRDGAVVIPFKRTA